MSLVLALALMRPQCFAWDSELTENLLGDRNRDIAAAAEAAGEQNWTEIGVGVNADGQTYLQQVVRGRPAEHIRAGLLLVSTSQVQGDVFDKSVVLLVKHDRNGTLGLVLNKPARLPPDEHMEIHEVLEDAFGVMPRNPRATEHLLAGGPVAAERVTYLHSGTPAGTRKRCYADGSGGVKFVGSNGEFFTPDQDAAPPVGEEVLGGVYFQSSSAFLKCALRDTAGPTLRIFLGYSGWGPQQLDGEWRRGAWTLCEASADAVFASDVGGLWTAMSSGEMGLRLCSRVSQAQSGTTWSENLPSRTTAWMAPA